MDEDGYNKAKIWYRRLPVGEFGMEIEKFTTIPMQIPLSIRGSKLPQKYFCLGPKLSPWAWTNPKVILAEMESVPRLSLLELGLPFLSTCNKSLRPTAVQLL
jgi:hypothetical protein